MKHGHLFMALAAIVAGASTALASDPKAGSKKAAACQTCHGIDSIARIPIIHRRRSDGSLLVSDDLAGAIYRISYGG